MAKRGLLNQNIEEVFEQEPVVEITHNNVNEPVEVIPQENLELKSLVNEEEREKIVEKWENSGILDKLENNLNENIALQFESKNSFTINEPIRKKSVSQLSRSELTIYQKTGILPDW